MKTDARILAVVLVLMVLSAPLWMAVAELFVETKRSR